MVRGHGSFAVGQMIEEAYQWTSSLEQVCRIICLTKSLQGEIKDSRSEKFKAW
jgi:L-fuculose-phosphate aldolase